MQNKLLKHKVTILIITIISLLAVCFSYTAIFYKEYKYKQSNKDTYNICKTPWYHVDEVINVQDATVQYSATTIRRDTKDIVGFYDYVLPEETTKITCSVDGLEKQFVYNIDLLRQCESGDKVSFKAKIVSYREADERFADYKYVINLELIQEY